MKFPVSQCLVFIEFSYVRSTTGVGAVYINHYPNLVVAAITITWLGCFRCCFGIFGHTEKQGPLAGENIAVV